LFAAELEKFRPYQQRLASTVHHQEVALQELATLWQGLKDLAGRGPGARKWEEREKRKKETVKRFSRTRDVYMEVRDGLAYAAFFNSFTAITLSLYRKGLQFYAELTELATKLRASVRSFVAERTTEREALVAKLETEKRLTASTTSPPPLAAKPPIPPPPTRSSVSIDSTLSSLSLRDPPQQYGGSPYEISSSTQKNHAHINRPPAPPPPPLQQHLSIPSSHTKPLRITLPHLRSNNSIPYSVPLSSFHHHHHHLTFLPNIPSSSIRTSI
jgi:hypothetical protein